jgi:hypothetical protein
MPSSLPGETDIPPRAAGEGTDFGYIGPVEGPGWLGGREVLG